MSDDLETNGPRPSSNESGVALVRYFERVFAEFKEGHHQRHTDENRAVEHATRGVEASFLSHQKAHDAKHASDQEALKQQRETTDLRLKAITGDYVTKDELANFKEAEQARRRTVNLSIAAMGLTAFIALVTTLLK
jgi:hypothetical protein